MPIKMGTDQQHIFNTVSMLVEKKGMNIPQSIEEVEKILRCELPEDIKDRIRQVCG